MQSDIKVASWRGRDRRTLLARILRTYAAAFVLVILACVSGLAAWRMYGRMAHASAAESAAREQLSMVKHQYNTVNADLAQLSTPQGQEGELRHRYGMSKPGEGVIEIVAPAPATSTTPQAVAAGFLSRIWHAFFP